jgi:acyl-CoA synthetase (AMP-forming)/AMP-acid ligase II
MGALCEDAGMREPARVVAELLLEYRSSDLAPSHALCDRHPPDAVAATLVGPDLATADLSFGELRERSERLARGLADLGVGPGTRVATLLPKVPELLVALPELGMVVVNAWHPDLMAPIQPGSMGRSMPGFTVGVLEEERDELASPAALGRVAVAIPASSLMWFAGYNGDAGQTLEKFTADGRRYLTGDTGHIDEDGYLFFSARDDDVIITAGYRIGPFEIESALSAHSASPRRPSLACGTRPADRSSRPSSCCVPTRTPRTRSPTSSRSWSSPATPPTPTPGGCTSSIGFRRLPAGRSSASSCARGGTRSRGARPGTGACES